MPMSMFHKKHDRKDDSLIREIKNTQRALEAAYTHFNNVLDPDLIDCSIYELNAIQLRYKFLLKQAKNAEHYSAINI